MIQKKLESLEVTQGCRIATNESAHFAAGTLSLWSAPSQTKWHCAVAMNRITLAETLSGLCDVSLDWLEVLKNPPGQPGQSARECHDGKQRSRTARL